MHSFRRLWEYLHDDPRPTANLDSTRTREQPELSPSLCGTENKELNPSNSGGFSLIWTALGRARPLQIWFCFVFFFTSTNRVALASPPTLPPASATPVAVATRPSSAAIPGFLLPDTLNRGLAPARRSA